MYVPIAKEQIKYLFFTVESKENYKYYMVHLAIDFFSS